MIEQGALDEARALMALSLDPALPVSRALGMRELSAHLRGEMGLEAAVTLAQQATRQYAKRQTTWFRHQLVADFDSDAKFSESLQDKILPIIRQFLLTKVP
jgi:tRNA dimethylallyltransferase